MAENIIKTFTIRVDTSNGKFEVDGLTQGFVKQETALKSLNKEVQKQNKELGKLVDKSGLAGAAVVEIGRTISDSNYGITAMANNISQLSTLLVTLIATTGSTKNAWDSLMKAFKGPLGIIVIFQIIVALIERFAMKQKEASKAVEYFETKLRSQNRELEVYIKRINDSNTSDEKRNDLLREMATLNEELNLLLNDRNASEEELIRRANEYYEIAKLKTEADLLNKILQDEVREVDNERIKIQKEIIRLQREEQYLLDDPILEQSYQGKVNLSDIQIDIIRQQEKLNGLNEERNVIEEDFLAVRESLNNLETRRIANAPRSVSFYEEQISLLKNQRDATALTKEEYDSYTKAIKLNEDAIKSITGEEEKSAKKRKGFVSKKLLFDDDILKSEQNVTKQTIHGKEQQLRAESQYQIDLAGIKFEEYANREQDRVDAIEDPKLRAKAQVKADKSIAESRDSLSRFIIQKSKETSTRINLLQINDLQKARLAQADFMDAEAEALLSFNAIMATNELDRIASERLLNDEEHKNKLDKIDEEIAARKLAKQSYVDLEEEKTNEVNGYERQQTKFKEKEEKTKLAIANQVGQAIIGIAGEGSAVGKAVAVAMAIMNTKEAITAALGAKPYGPWNIAQAVAVGAFGMKQVQEIMSTKLPVEAAGGGGVGSISVSAPDFNVVGQGAGSQLAGVVGARFGEPIKAYVLSSDVSSAQELDRKIDSTATIG
jgi:hypothetical protein